MPTSFVGVLLFVVLLAPGFCYRSRRSASQPVRKPTPLRELADLVLRSVVSNSCALAAFGVVRSLAPGLTPDVGRLVREGSVYVKEDYLSLLLWGGGLLLFACLIALASAGIVSSPAMNRVMDSPLLGGLRRAWPTRLFAGDLRKVTHAPAWWRMLAGQVDQLVFAGCEMDDGSYLGGYVYRFSAESDETADRELVLTKPVYRPAGGTEAPLDVSAVIVSARRLQYLTVTYLPNDGQPAPTASTA